MSTRTNILIVSGKTRLYLYRHHDGYLSNTGANLARLYGAAEDFIRALLNETYDDGKRVYEVTSETHGDIEHFYGFIFDRTGRLDGIYYAYRDSHHNSELSGSDLELAALGTRFTIDGFRDLVNKDIRETNNRLTARGYKNVNLIEEITA